ncbi:NADP-dependent 3-hydroxy acid dehydrogenase YdfG [Spirosoma oryzae]|uniref:NADP-dependent 3-hydroxy acid dehydrogenase YdfG n=1 Tax=Spirosoma oryzae TaxID=1469603 RepID=A0A2T0SAH0_9BACT|nr:SDR family oxidoreductase [Spirosoma oryzae]PRY30425.1 NADP-dependent 3-hydroxy acid dehydrogenase YdfG [Spirosoma oryzae]
MKNKTVFISGTNSGFGKVAVERFTQEGWQVAATVRNKADHPGLFDEFPTVKLYSLDTSNNAQVEEVAKAVIADFKRIDVVINNAGYCLMGPTETTSMEQIVHQYETNIFGVFAVTKSFISHFRQHGGGTFINLSSSSGLFNYPFIAAYGSSKWAVRGLSEALGIELAPFNIQVKVIYPGTHATKIFTKLEQGAAADNPAYQPYRQYYKTFLLAQTKLPATVPVNVVEEMIKAANNPRGPINIIAGGDAKFLDRMKKLLPERVFQKLQLRIMKSPMTKPEIGFFTRLFGRRVAKMEMNIEPDLIK